MKNFLFHFSIEIEDDKVSRELLESGEVVLILSQADSGKLLVTVERTGEVVGEGKIEVINESELPKSTPFQELGRNKPF